MEESSKKMNGELLKRRLTVFGLSAIEQPPTKLTGSLSLVNSCDLLINSSLWLVAIYCPKLSTWLSVVRCQYLSILYIHLQFNRLTMRERDYNALASQQV